MSGNLVMAFDEAMHDTYRDALNLPLNKTGLRTQKRRNTVHE